MLSAQEILELEKKYSSFIIKKLLTYVFSGTSVLSIVVFAYLYVSQNNKILDNNVSNIIAENNNASTFLKSSENNITIVQNTHSSTKSIDVLELQSPKVILSNIEKESSSKLAYPREDFDTTGTNHSAIKEETVLSSPQPRKIQPPLFRTKEEQIDEALLPPPLDNSKDSKPKGFIKIESQQANNSLGYLKEKFESTHSIIFALMIAEEYYKSGDFLDANKWSLIANNIDISNEKSWLLFAKSKVKLGQKEDAMRALKSFLQTNKSQAAQNLLNQISMGESIN